MIQKIFFRLLFLLFVLSIHGCSPIDDYKKPIQKEIILPIEEDQALRLLRQGERYAKLNSKQYQAVCKQLKQDYSAQSDWQTAWLLVYSLNDKFNCVSLKNSLELLKTIQSKQELNVQLKWLNKSQISMIEAINKLKAENNHKKQQLKKTQQELKQAEGQLHRLNANIQELKAIETSIIKKTQ